VLAKSNFNNSFLVINERNFRYNNLNAGVNINVPIYSAKTRANVALAQVNLEAAKINLSNTKSQVSAEVRQKSRKVQQADATKEVARLELQLSQQNLAVLQSQFGDGQGEFAATWRRAAWTKMKNGCLIWTRTSSGSRRNWTC